MKRFLENAPLEPTDIESYMRTSALRWCSDRPIFGPIQNETLEAHMDRFIDHWLYFLPIPRFQRPFKPEEFALETCINLSLERLCFERHEGPIYVAEANECFHAMWPHLKKLRDTSLRPEAHALLLCLMALDPLACYALDSKALDHPEFTVRAYEAIKEEVGHSETDAIKALSASHDHLTKRSLAKLLKDPRDFTLWQSAKDQGLTSKDIDDQVEAFLNETSLKHGLDVTQLRPHVAIKNFLDEDIEIQLIN